MTSKMFFMADGAGEHPGTTHPGLYPNAICETYGSLHNQHLKC